MVATAETLSALENNRERAASRLALALAEGQSGSGALSPRADSPSNSNSNSIPNTTLKYRRSLGGVEEDDELGVDDFATSPGTGGDMSFEDDLYESEGEEEPSSLQSATDLSISAREKSLLEEQESSIEREKWRESVP